jgi:hypothetical protein
MLWSAKTRRPCAAVTAAFELFDLDGNCTLEEHEFLGSFVLFGHVDIDRKIEFRFKQIDTDGSGQSRRECALRLRSRLRALTRIHTNARTMRRSSICAARNTD